MSRGQVHRSSQADPTFWKLLPSIYKSESDATEWEPLSWVYFILDHDSGQVKIGYTTKSVEGRLEDHCKRRFPNRLELLGTLRGGYDLERCMHGRFSDYRVERHEWYSAEILPEVLELLR